MLWIPQVWRVVWNPRKTCKSGSFLDIVQAYRAKGAGAIVVRSPRP
jgi:hypothetical protein